MEKESKERVLRILSACNTILSRVEICLVKCLVHGGNKLCSPRGTAT